ncbi:hypothetical protein K1719_042707 [Acacia pycnantha]|nr:hypothetical protein K1719_042707 [Acacia pycnantha]
MKNVSRSGSKLSSCFRPDDDLDAAVPHPPPPPSRMSCLPLPPKPTSSLLAKALNLRRRSSGDGRAMLTQAAKAPNIPETKEEPPPPCCSKKPDGKESRREDKSNRLGIFMVVFSLTLTVMVGKYWGILLTSTWLYLFSLAKARKGNATRQVQFPKNRTGKECWGDIGSSASMKLP